MARNAMAKNGNWGGQVEAVTIDDDPCISFGLHKRDLFPHAYCMNIKTSWGAIVIINALYSANATQFPKIWNYDPQD